MGFMSMEGQAGMSGPSASTSNPYPDPQASGSVATGLGEDKLLLFIATPRVCGVTTIEVASELVHYAKYIVTEQTPKSIKRAIRTAPEGFAIQELETEEDRIRGINVYLIHDVVGVL
jgi:hypothetical protein